MQLSIKFYSDKSPRLGISYPSEYAAVKEYERLISKLSDTQCWLKMEIRQNKLQLTLISLKTGASHLYNDLEFKPEQLKLLSLLDLREFPVHFLHIFARENIWYLAKPFRKQTFIEVMAIEWLGGLQPDC